ncbi:MAG: hypothetical protein R3Y24_14715 [Eubacteriales bacterium]
MVNIKEAIRDADMVLVGIGEAFRVKLDMEEFSDDMQGVLKKRACLQSCKGNQISQAYDSLSELLIDKNYFIVTLCNDDLILKSSLKQDKIVAPCGTYKKLQCENGCAQTLLHFDDEIDLESQICEECGGKLCFNLFETPHYNEAGYLPMWEKYTKWIQGSLNKKILVLELGVGFAYPSVIRWPFEKIAFFNHKASFYRVHDSLYQISDELHEKGIAIQENPIQFLLEQV